jgi:hypothetical protein
VFEIELIGPRIDAARTEAALRRSVEERLTEYAA